MPVIFQFFAIALPLMVAAYLIGSIPFGLILTKAAGLGDVRAIGSGNIGATNVLRTGNKKLAAATLLLDALKGYLAIALLSGIPVAFNLIHAPAPVLGQPLFDSHSASDMLFVTTYINLPPLLGVAVLLGHIYPIWLKFKGGKGVATYIGALAAISPIIALAFAASWVGVFKATRISSLSALTAAFTAGLVAVVAAVLTNTGFGWTETTARAVFIIFGAAMLFYTHRANIARLKAGTEPRFGKPKADEADEEANEGASA